MNIIEYQRDLLKVRRFRSEPKFEVHDNCIEIISSKDEKCFIDLVDADLSNYPWSSNNNYFVRYTSRSHPTQPNKGLWLAPMILERKIGRPLKEGEYCDHIDWNKENNHRSNLRLANKHENAYNVKPRSPGRSLKRKPSSLFKGVTKAVNTYRVQINYSVSISKTGFRDETEAAKTYDKLAAEHHGKFAVFNFPEDWVFDLAENRYKHAESISNNVLRGISFECPMPA